MQLPVLSHIFNVFTWRSKFTIPCFNASTFSSFKLSLAIPPCILIARIVATTTTADGSKPASRALISMNFSAPKSDPKPASVTTISAKSLAVSVAKIELQPCAMLANGPPCTNAGVPQLFVPSSVSSHLLKSSLTHLQLLGQQRLLAYDYVYNRL